ncbi:MAG: DUF2628 domain-containing protein [Alphaproteobacteria bacterium]
MKVMERVTTISEFIASPALEETIVTNCPKYREKFSKIIEKADVQESDTKDEQAIKKIISTLSWNWAAFLFSYLWLIYRRENLLGWGLLIVVWGLTLIWAYSEDTTLDTITDVLPMAVCIAVGILGNSLILRNAMKAYEDTTLSVDLKQHSPKALCLAILLKIGMLGMVILLEFFNN